MIKKVVGILIIGLLMTTIFPVGSSIAQLTDEKANIMKIDKLALSIEIKINGGWGINTKIKNIGTTDLKDVNMEIVLDGRMIFPGYKDRVATMDLEAGKTHWVIFPVRGFGVTNIRLTVDTITETLSGHVLGSMIFGVK
jgi:hypothetical protein